MTALISKASKKPSVGLTPLIDVVFILLIFFMLVMQFQGFQQNDIKLTTTSANGLKQEGVARVTVMSETTCEYMSREESCSDIFRQLHARHTTRLVLAYSDSAMLKDVMAHYDVLSEQFSDVTLAVSLPAGAEEAK